MRVTYECYIFFEETFDVGGIETFMVNVIKYLDRNKYQISLVTIQKILIILIKY